MLLLLPSMTYCVYNRKRSLFDRYETKTRGTEDYYYYYTMASKKKTKEGKAFMWYNKLTIWTHEDDDDDGDVAK